MMWNLIVAFVVLNKDITGIFQLQNKIEKSLGFECGASGFYFPTSTRDMVFYFKEEGDAKKTKGIVETILKAEVDLKWTTELNKE